LLRLRQLRPFPDKLLLSYIKPGIKIAVLDRNLSPGTGGVFTQEIRASLNGNGYQNQVYEFIAGLGGRDITSDNIIEIFSTAENNRAEISKINWLGLKK
ncbi:MAG: pyruvate ferredoxin oxidoreductase, partial [Candidatus Zixiibacteriota bacterium]